MKRFFIIILSVLSVFLLAASCEKADGEAEYGNLLVYIPQAMTNGTIDNIYDVPSGDAEYTYNFRVQEGVVNVFLSVYRSGKIKAREVIVDVIADLNSTAAQAEALGAETMPSSLYTLPAKAGVPAGVNSGSFYLAVPKASLMDETHAGKIYVLCVRIANPSNYELNEDASEVVVRLDVDALKACL